MIDFHIESGEADILKHRGVDPQLLYGQKDEFDLASVCLSFKPRHRYVRSMAVESSAKQVTNFSKMLLSPYASGNYAPLVSICSFPTDERAKLTALQLFRAAVDESSEQLKKPYWHRIYSEYPDFEKIRAKNPNLLVISGVDLESGKLKIEILRDLLEMFSTIPRIVVHAGANDPYKLFNDKLHLKPTWGMLIGSERPVKNLMDLMDL